MAENKENMTTSPTNTSAAPNAGMDLASIMAAQQQKKEEAKETPTETKVTKSSKSEPKEKKKTPLEELIEHQRSVEGGKGAVYENSDIQVKEPKKQFKNIVESDERMAAFDESIEYEDERLKARQAVVLLKRPSEREEYIAVESELDMVEFDEEGHAYFNNKTTDKRGNEVIIKPEWFKIRTEEYGPYNEETEKLYSLGKSPEEVKQIMAVKEKEEISTEDAMNEVDKNETKIDPETGEEKTTDRKQLVQILIDKTGYGIPDMDFTDEERQQIIESDTVLVTSVKKLDIAGIKVKAKNEDGPARTFQQVAREHQMADSHAEVAFPVSGFRAQFRGLTYGELSDIATSQEPTNFEREYKKCTVIYNAMLSNTRPEPFEDFDDFLKNFAYQDLDMAIYGLYVATFPDNQFMSLRCGNQGCGKNFQKAYNTRTVLKIDSGSDGWLDLYSKVALAQPYDFVDVFNNAPLQNSKYFEMPYSKYILEICPATLYDYLYRVIPISDPDEFFKVFGITTEELQDEATAASYAPIADAMNAIGTVRRVLVPDTDGSYVDFGDVEDIVDCVKSLNPQESKIVRSMALETLQDWTTVFGLDDIECPYCHTKTEELNVDISSLVFHMHDQQRNTVIDVTSLLQM